MKMISDDPKGLEFLMGIIKSNLGAEKKKALIFRKFRGGEYSSKAFEPLAEEIRSLWGLNIWRLIEDPFMERVAEEYSESDNALGVFNLSEIRSELFQGFSMGESMVSPEILLEKMAKYCDAGWENSKAFYLIVGNGGDCDVRVEEGNVKKARVLVRVRRKGSKGELLWGFHVADGSMPMAMEESFEFLREGAAALLYEGEEKKEDIAAGECVALKIGQRIITFYRLIFRWLKDSDREAEEGLKFFTIQLGGEPGELRYNEPITGHYMLVSGEGERLSIQKNGDIDIEPVPPEKLTTLLALQLRGNNLFFTHISKENAIRNKIDYKTGTRYFSPRDEYFYAFKKISEIESALNDKERNPTLAKKRELILIHQIMPPQAMREFYKKEELLNIYLANLRIAINMAIVQAVQKYVLNFEEIMKRAKGKKLENPEIRAMVLCRIIELFRDVIPQCELETGDGEKILIEDENYYIDYSKVSQFKITLGYFVNGGIIIKDIGFFYTGRELRKSLSMPALKPHLFEFKTKYGPEDNPNARFVLGKNIFGGACPAKEYGG